MTISLLVVEDDPTASNLLQGFIAIKLPQVAVLAAENGVAGLEICKADAPDIVVTDINMPDMDGVSMVREIKAIRPKTKIIMVTGYASYKRDEIGVMDIHDYFVKPTDFKRLIAAIETCMDEIAEERGGTPPTVH